MKKFLKTVLGVGAVAAIAGGVYYAYKNYIQDNEYDDFDDDDFDDFEDVDNTERNYVKLNIDGEEKAEEVNAADAEEDIDSIFEEVTESEE